MVVCVLAAHGAPGAAYQQVVVQGETSNNGMLDPSVEFDSAGLVGWMAYSAIHGTRFPWGPHVETHLARSLDNGATWTFVQVVNPSSAVTTITVPGVGDVDGVWNNEVASLVHDPMDAGREWKMFTHHIFQDYDASNLPAFGWITYRSASDPAGTWSDEVALFGAGIFPPPPYDNTQIDVNALDPSLAGMVAYSEPGPFVHDGVLYLSLTALGLTGPDRIILLASDDHGETWRYAGTVLTNADAVAIGYLKFDGTSIAADGGRLFLLAAPASPGVTHDGTLVLEFADIATAQLLRDQSGAVVVRKHIPLDPEFVSAAGGGQADYHSANLTGGLVLNQINLPEFPTLFQFHETGERLATEFTVCDPTPRSGCLESTEPAKSKLAVRRKPSGDATLSWRWQGGTVTTADLGDPTTAAGYALCFYDEAGALRARAQAPAGSECGAKPCWKASATGFRYRDRVGVPDGLRSVVLRAADPGRSKLRIRGTGEHLSIPSLPLALPMQVQLQTSAGPCWESLYLPAGVIKNDAIRFKGRSSSAGG